jgi:hypothetical protein
VSPLLQRFVGQIVNEPTFPDFCTPTGKWFRSQENCFVARFATKQFGIQYQQFQRDGFWSDIGPIGPAEALSGPS